MILVDTHCDTFTRIMESGEELKKNSGHIDLERMESLGKYVQFFACYIDTVYNKSGMSLKRVLEILDTAHKEIEKNKEKIALCTSYSDILQAVEQKKVAAMLAIEGGEALAGEIYVLRMLYKLGVRSICLTWNNRNEIADGVSESVTGGGLTGFGRDVIAEMNKLGMIIDVSHIAERGFWDVIDLTKQPIIASHSNAKKICNNIRNLTDEQIIAIHKNGGVIGMNLCDEFISKNLPVDILGVIRHIEYIASLVGTENIGIGADFDGIEELPNGIEGVQDITKIFEELAKLNYSDIDIAKIAGNNFLRVIKQVLK